MARIQFKQIINGWRGYIFDDPRAKEIAEERAEICSGCEYYRHGKLLEWIGDEIKTIEGAYCNLCKCPLSSKLRSLENECSDNPPKWQPILNS